MSINIESKVQELIGDIIENIGYTIYDLQYVKEGKDYYLRVFIEKANKEEITLDDCEKVSNAINETLDKADFIKEQYFLEVSSTGIEKTLRKKEHYINQIGNEIEVKLFKPINKNKQYIGILKRVEDSYIILENNNEEVKIDFKDISTSKTVYNW